MQEPFWRTVLCWTAVLTFFTSPALLFTLHAVAVQQSWTIAQHWHEFKIGAFYETITALVFGLAGLRSFDRAWEIKHNGNNAKKERPESDKKP